ncbi:MAG: 16S rRNA (guanine(527)-N(7))-methyltransferase RsmG [Nitrospirae bacterium]|nr:16S rRNA (guanine(527)-N(7))-methyltransferase RsmG [Nitrospirota bacterium]
MRSAPDLLGAKNLLEAGARSLDCLLTDHQINQFLNYLADLKEWNRRINLTSITTNEEIVEKHFLDSLAGLQAIKKHTGRTMLDIGAGAGFPGLPLKISFPEIRLTLVESSQKKAAFLHHLVGKLKLSETTVLNRRAETLLDGTDRYGWIVVRAFAKTDVVLTRALPLLSPDGRLILYQSRLQTTMPIREMKGWEETIRYMLPFSKIERRLEIFRCVS